MGCCNSAPAAPDVVMPDPMEGEACTFSLKKAGMMSSDYIAYKGEETDNDDNKWFFVNKTGSMWSGDAVIDIENFTRGGNEEKPNQGEISWHASFCSSPEFEKHHKAPSTEFTRFVSWFSNGRVDLDGEEPEDEVYFQSGGWSMNDGGNRRVMKWSLKTSADITAVGARGQQFGPEGFSMNVFARGTSIADYDERFDEEGNQSWHRQEMEFVDHLCFNIVQKSTGQEIAAWSVPGDLAGGDMVSMSNTLFDMDIRGGWFNSKPLINTKQNWDPLFALVVAYLAAFEYSPKEIKSDLNSDFPSDPFGWQGW